MPQQRSADEWLLCIILVGGSNNVVHTIRVGKTTWLLEEVDLKQLELRM